MPSNPFRTPVSVAGFLNRRSKSALEDLSFAFPSSTHPLGTKEVVSLVLSIAVLYAAPQFRAYTDLRSPRVPSQLLQKILPLKFCPWGIITNGKLSRKYEHP
jgi:hypothetical protein